jgi:dihydroneopterin aldolase
MTDDLATAFRHPAARAETLGPDTPRDRISMTDHLREVEIGAFQAERGVLQAIRFDVVVEVETRAETAADDVDRILSYDTIVEAIDASLAAERVDLLETLAARVAEAILAHPLAARVFVRIGKLDRGPYTLGVEIVRDAAPGRRRLRLLADQAPHPVVVFLSDAAVARPDLAALLDRLEAGGAPLILCVEAPTEMAVPAADHPMAQRRIDLLAIEMGAWRLAGRDRRCVVTQSRTELDWAMRQGRISVWAPSKLVLDAVDGVDLTGALSLAHWLAAGFEASAIVEIGRPAEPAPDGPARDRPVPGLPVLRLEADAMPAPSWAEPTA